MPRDEVGTSGYLEVAFEKGRKRTPGRHRNVMGGVPSRTERLVGFVEAIPALRLGRGSARKASSTVFIGCAELRSRSQTTKLAAEPVGSPPRKPGRFTHRSCGTVRPVGAGGKVEAGLFHRDHSFIPSRDEPITKRITPARRVEADQSRLSSM